MSYEIRYAVTFKLPEEPDQAAAHKLTIYTAWRAFCEAVKASNPQVTDDYAGPAKSVRRRRGRPRLTVAEPPTAA